MAILKTDPKRGKALMAKEYPTMAPETNEQAYDGEPDLDPGRPHDRVAGARDVRILATQGHARSRFRIDIHK